MIEFIFLFFPKIHLHVQKLYSILIGKAASPAEYCQGVELFRFFTQVEETRDGLVRGVIFFFLMMM